jgi:hypothetical protein
MCSMKLLPKKRPCFANGLLTNALRQVGSDNHVLDDVFANAPMKEHTGDAPTFRGRISAVLNPLVRKGLRVRIPPRAPRSTVCAMPVTVELPEDTLARLRAEAARRGVSIDVVIAELAAHLPAEDPLEAFIGCGASGRTDPLNIHHERVELAAQKLSEGV